MQHFFGHPDSQLFGVYHPARQSTKLRRGVVICPPVGQEYIRSHWSLRLIARQLARKGIAVFRFDYLGIGDSSGSFGDVESTEIWRQNLHQAIERLKELAELDSVMLLGHRLGGLFASEVAMQREDVHLLILWEPTLEGQAYLRASRKLHQKMLDLWVCKMKTANDEQYEELLGFLWRRSLIQELEHRTFSLPTLDLPHLLITDDQALLNSSSCVPGIRKSIHELRPSQWFDLSALETANLNPETTRIIVQNADEMFGRIEKLQQRSGQSVVSI
ncbi:MAG: alpha/beta hydrolase [Planctomycetota bacterium]